MKYLPMIILTLIITLFIAVALFQSSEKIPTTSSVTSDCSRIITMSPSVTDTVWALALGKKVIATDKFSSWPEAVKSLPKVGGFLDPNIEQIATMKPSLIIIPQSAQKSIAALEKLGLATLTVNHATLAGVEDSFLSIATACGVQKIGEELQQSFRKNIEVPQNSNKKPSLLLVVSRDMTDKGMKNIIAVGDDKLLSELIIRAGGTNALAGSRPYSMIQREKIISLQPDIVVDVVLSSDKEKDVIKMWKESGLQGKVIVVNKQWAVVPGPRMVKFIQLLKTTISEL